MFKPKLSISLVTYRPDLKLLSVVLAYLGESLVKNKIQTILYLIDNSCESTFHSNIKNCLDSNFVSNEIVQSEFIINSENIGYGRANNIAINRTLSDYHVVINPDVFVNENTFLYAIQYMEKNPAVGLLTPAVFNEKGDQQFLCKKHPTLFDMFLRSFAPKFVRKKFSKRILAYEMRDHDYNEEIDNICFPTGCFMFFRTNELKKINGFDPDFFMYYEDADIGRRITKHAKVTYVPKVKIIHKWARGTHTNRKLKWVTIKSGLVYWKKWGGVF